MELDEVLRRRRMVRAYLPDPVPAEMVDRVVDAARRAPTAGHSQGQAWIVVMDPTVRSRLASVAGEEAALARGLPPWISTAPVLVVPCAEPAVYDARYAEPDKRRSRPPAARAVPWPWVDAGQALMALQLAAVAEGLGVGLLDVTDRSGLRRVLGIPDDVEPLGLVTLGRPAPDGPVGSALRPRRPRVDVVHHDRW